MLRPDLAGSRILIVDDQPDNIRLLEDILASAGPPDCFTTTDPREVARICAESQPDLILLDLHMPHMDGIAVMAELARRRSQSDYVPILVLTSDVSPTAKRRAFEMGATDFLLKPFDPSEFILRARNLLRISSLFQELRRQNEDLEQSVADCRRQLAEHDLAVEALVAHFPTR